MRNLLLSVLLGLGASLSHADTAPVPTAPTTPAQYNCHLILAALDLKDTVQDTFFKAAADSGVHGGQDYVFNFGPHELTVTASARWRGITWKKDGVTIASGVTVLDRDSEGSQVIMVFNPSNPDEEYATLECSP